MDNIIWFKNPKQGKILSLNFELPIIHLTKVSNMEMPVQCQKCKDIVELNSTRESNLTKKLLCSDCCSEENEVFELVSEADDIRYDLENYAEHMKGDRRGWKNNLKELKEKIKSFGYDYDFYSKVY